MAFTFSGRLPGPAPLYGAGGGSTPAGLRPGGPDCADAGGVFFCPGGGNSAGSDRGSYWAEPFRYWNGCALWTWDGTNKTVPEVLGIALPGSAQTDNGDGTVSISGAMMTERVYPVPAGIKIILRSP